MTPKSVKRFSGDVMLQIIKIRARKG